MNTPSRQRGLSTISWVLIILVAVFFGTCAVKLLPVYMQSWTVDGAISKLVDSGELRGKTPGGIRQKLTKILDVNRVEAVTVRDIKITRDKGYTTIDATYEQRIPLMYNIDVVLKFDKLVYEFATATKEG